MDPAETARVRRLARDTFVADANTFGCSESTYVVLERWYELPEPDDSSPAMAPNGGVAYQGGVCGAVTGAALAVGQLAARRIDDRAVAKRVARGLVQRLIDEFERRFGATECRKLTGFDLRLAGEHERFIESGVWKRGCADQVDFAVESLAELSSEAGWERAVAALATSAG